MPHINEARKTLNSHDPCNIEFVTKKGEWVVAKDVVCTSSFHHGNTVNIKFRNSEEFRKVKVVLIMSVNNQEVYL